MDLLFKDFGLDVQYLQAVDRLGFHQPTPIQQSAIPLLLEGMDVLGQAQTGTGKPLLSSFLYYSILNPVLGIFKH